MPPVYITVLGLLLFFQHNAWCSAENDTLMAGQALAVGDKLVSRNRKFALGFFQPQSTSKSSTENITSSNWYLGIWFNKIPVFTTVWVANREKPIKSLELNQTQLKISRDGNHVILSHVTTETMLWSSEIVDNSTRQSNNTIAVLSNNGNLVIRPASDPSMVWWQSFDYPTDVYLPGSKLGYNKVTDLNRVFVSKKNQINPGLGSYCVDVDARLNTGINLKHRSSSVVYWASGTYTQQVVDPGDTGLTSYTHVGNSVEDYYVYSLPNDSLSVFTLVETSGQIKAYVWLEASQHWKRIYSQPMEPCAVHAACGPFTVCNTGNANLSCDCMHGFSVKSPEDWDLDDRSGGCVRNSALDCSSNKTTGSSTDKFLPIPSVSLTYQSISIQATDVSECSKACANDCSCTAYSYGSSGCSVWHGDLLNTATSSAGDTLYLRLANKDIPMPSSSKNRVALLVGVIAASIVGFGSLVLILFFFIWKRSKCYGKPLNYTQDCGGIVAFRYSDLDHATKSFSEKLGGGGFGSVYKGMLIDSTTIAVKRLDGVHQGEKQFRAEVSTIGLIQHINLVKLIGFCCQGDKRLLVYEHMLNGSLDAHLFKSNGVVLNWSTRYQIAIGVARGLFYLHESCCECIIHCDIKPENILLDALFVPKIADFGLAKFVGRDYSRVLTTFRGTIGYLAPEWISGVAITSKVDVYSFGMVLLEIISGRRNSPKVGANSDNHDTYFPVQAIVRLHEGDIHSLVDPQLTGDFSLEQAERLCKVAFWCIQDNESIRPTMGEVVRVLEGMHEIDVPPMPRLLASITNNSDTASM